MRCSHLKGIALQAAILALTRVAPCAAADKPIVHHQYVKSATTAALRNRRLQCCFGRLTTGSGHPDNVSKRNGLIQFNH